MSLNYNVQEHLIIDLDRAGAAGSAVWEALVEQVRALEDLLDEDEVCIYRLELWADGEPVPVDRKISCAGLGQALKGARRMEMVLRFNSTWRGTDAVYDDALPFDLTETAAQLTDEELDGIFCSAWIQLEDYGELGRLVAIGRRGDSIIGRCVAPEGKPSRTEYTIIKEENGHSLAACVPVTGRTHQIRVHFASIGHPLAGDNLYGGSRERIGRQALHCARQSFAVPVYTPLPDGIRVEMPLQLRTVTVESPLPPDMEGLFS